MKKLIILLFLSSIILNAQTIRYYSPQGNGTTGTSWANAWNSVDDIDWTDLAGGGWFLMDGNSIGDSIVYDITLTPTASGSWLDPIRIVPASFYPGSQPDSVKGTAIIDHNLTGGQPGISISGSYHWITIKGLTIRHTGDTGIYLYAPTVSGNPYRIHIDSCTIYEVNANECVEILGYYSGTPNTTNMALLDTTAYIHHVEISNNNMRTHTNRSMPESNIIYGHLTGWLNIHHNTLHQRNLQQGGTDHIDPIQLSYSNHSVRIYNNILVTDSAVTGHTMILGLMARTSDYQDTTIVYNNYVYNGGATCATNWKQEILWRAPEGDIPSVQHAPLVYSINNTIVARNGCCWPSCAEGAYNPQESNNMIVHFGENGAEPNMDGNSSWYTTYNSGDYKQADSNKTNLFYQSWGQTNGFGGNHWEGSGGSPTGVPTDWTDYVNTFGGTGVNDDPEFVNNTRIPSDNPYEISSTSPAIDAGTNMSYILNRFEYLPQFDASTDILGNPRDSNWDIGAFEYQQGAPAGVINKVLPGGR